jgi:hypothetical protein
LRSCISPSLTFMAYSCWAWSIRLSLFWLHARVAIVMLQSVLLCLLIHLLPLADFRSFCLLFLILIKPSTNVF